VATIAELARAFTDAARAEGNVCVAFAQPTNGALAEDLARAAEQLEAAVHGSRRSAASKAAIAREAAAAAEHLRELARLCRETT